MRLAINIIELLILIPTALFGIFEITNVIRDYINKKNRQYQLTTKQYVLYYLLLLTAVSMGIERIIRNF